MFRPQLGIRRGPADLCAFIRMHMRTTMWPLGEVRDFADLDTTSAGTLKLQNNAFFGVKFGHYVNDRQFNWLGWEVDLYRAAAQRQTANRPKLQ